MNANQKRHFIDSLIMAIRRDVHAKIPEMPDNWDGHELRCLIAERFNEAASISEIRREPRRRRARE